MKILPNMVRHVFSANLFAKQGWQNFKMIFGDKNVGVMLVVCSERGNISNTIYTHHYDGLAYYIIIHILDEGF